MWIRDDFQIQHSIQLRVEKYWRWLSLHSINVVVDHHLHGWKSRPVVTSPNTWGVHTTVTNSTQPGAGGSMLWTNRCDWLQLAYINPSQKDVARWGFGNPLKMTKEFVEKGIPVVSSWVDLPWKIAIGLADTAKHIPEITGDTVDGQNSVVFHIVLSLSQKQVPGGQITSFKKRWTRFQAICCQKPPLVDCRCCMAYSASNLIWI